MEDISIYVGVRGTEERPPTPVSNWDLSGAYFTAVSEGFGAGVHTIYGVVGSYPVCTKLSYDNSAGGSGATGDITISDNSVNGIKINAYGIRSEFIITLYDKDNKVLATGTIYLRE